MLLKTILRPAKPLYHWLRLRQIRSIVRWNAHNGILAVDIASNNGLGARLQNCLEIFAYCDDHGLLPRIKFTHRDDRTRLDYFERFFLLNTSIASELTVPFPRIYTIADLGFPTDYDKTLTLDRAHRLIQKYLGIRKPVLNEVDSFLAAHFGDGPVLGVHYRGTDKHSEAPQVGYARVLRNIRRYLQEFPATEFIFISTDDQNFLSAARGASLPRPVVSRADSYRSSDGEAVHYRPGGNKVSVYRDALVNCLLLSRCKALLKSASFLSDWSCLFNPRLELIMLNQPHAHTTWFPARELMKKTLYQAVE